MKMGIKTQRETRNLSLNARRKANGIDELTLERRRETKRESDLGEKRKMETMNEH